MNQAIKNAWTNPPRLYIVAQPMPNAPNLSITGSGTSTASLDNYLKDLQKDFDNQKGKYFAYAKKGCKEEADTFYLITWETYTSPESCYEALIMLYYAPINEYLCLKKHFSEEWAQKYLDEISAREAAITALAEALN